jgi:hypothetical protein
MINCKKDIAMAHCNRAGLIALFAIAGLSLAAAQEFKSTPAKQALSTYEEAVKKLNEEYGKSLNKLQEKYLADLEDARKTALSNNKLDEAQRILAASQEIKDQLNETAIPVQRIAWVPGTWKITYHPNQVERLYVIKRSGAVAFPAENMRGQLRLVGNDLILDLGGESLERLTFVGARRVFVEHFNPKADYPKKLNQVGIGNRVLPQR